MNIRCLLGHHDWKFAYNHGMPFGISTEKALAMLHSGESYPVDQCTRCPKQSYFPDNRRVLLSRSETEAP